LADGQPEKYDFSLTGEVPFRSSQAYRLQGKLKEGAESKFRRLVLLISKEGFFVLSAEFYDSHDELARQITVDDAGLVAGHWTRLRWTLDNRARQKKIDFETIDAKYNQNLSDSIFTRQHLKEIATKK
jgi:outer membrane lipoprotein-sorting protein